MAESPLGPDRFDDRVRLGELPRLQLGVNLLSIDADLKGAAPRRDELQGTDVLLELKNLLRQTDGMRFVISSGAIFDCDLETHT